jgi:trehalose utilization protein
MYDEPFHVPEPDVVIFEERWESGEWFRSGCLWQVGKGKVFYFRPGHETFPVYKEREVLQLLANAARWLGSPPTKELDARQTEIPRHAGFHELYLAQRHSGFVWRQEP